MTKRVLSASVALAIGLTLTACGGGGAASGTATSGASPSAATSAADRPTVTTSPAPADEHNAVDVMFVTMMIPHHEGAIEMSDVALTRASTQQVKDLAARIKAAQGPEIEQMQGWLADWAAAMPMTSAPDTSAPDMGGVMGGVMGGDVDHGMGHGSPTATGSTPASPAADFGMGDMMTMSEADMAALQAATGVAFDTLFLQQMIAHHQGAIGMADVEIAQGQSSQVLALAEAIKAGQTAEIAEMQQLLSTR